VVSDLFTHMNSISEIQKIEPFKPRTLKEFPAWMVKLLTRQDQLNQRYERAHGKFADAYNEFLMAVVEINDKFGTSFSLEQALAEFEGGEADDADDEDEDEDDEE